MSAYLPNCDHHNNPTVKVRDLIKMSAGEVADVVDNKNGQVDGQQKKHQANVAEDKDVKAAVFGADGLCPRA